MKTSRPIPKRALAVGAAVVVGLVAAFAAYSYLHSAQTRAYDNAKLTSAYVVTKPLPQGLAGAQVITGGYVARKQVPAEFRPAGAITNLADIEGTQAVAPIATGQILVAGMFASPSAAQVTFSRAIPAGDVAVTVSVSQVQGVAGLPQPGDHVDIMVTAASTEQYLLQNVPVLAIGTQTAPQSSTGTSTAAAGTAASASGTTTAPANGSGLFTFAVSPLDAERIAFAEQQGLGIYLALEPPGSKPAAVAPANQGNLFTVGPLAATG